VRLGAAQRGTDVVLDFLIEFMPGPTERPALKRTPMM